jgi:hypothetical protein
VEVRRENVIFLYVDLKDHRTAKRQKIVIVIEPPQILKTAEIDEDHHKGSKTTPPHPPHWISLRHGVESIDLALEDGFDIRKGETSWMCQTTYRSFISMS